MTPETLRLDRTFKGVGRIARATGTTQPTMRRRLSRMLTTLYEDGRLDVLRAIRDGDLTMLQVFDAVQRRTVDQLPVGATMQPTADAMHTWIETLLVPRDYSAKHVESLETSRRYFERAAATTKHATIAELPQLLEALRESLGRAHPRSFNLARAAALAFVRATLKRTHPLWLACAAVEPRRVEATAPRAPLTPAMIRNRFPAPATDPLDAIAIGMAVTGMGTREYWGPWSVLTDRVHIDGTKRAGRRRDVPLVGVVDGFPVPRPPTISRDWFEKQFRARCQRQITPYDLRRTYARWLESAGVPRTRRRLYLGHGVKDVSDLYEQHQIETFLVDDAERLRTFLRADSTKTPTNSRARPTVSHTARRKHA